MIREVGVITAVYDGWVEVSTQLKTGCSGCAHENHCGAGLISKAFPHRDGRIEIATKDAYMVGEKIELLMPENAMVKFSMLVYGLPLFVIALAALVAHSLWPSEEWMVILVTFMSAALTFIGVRLHLKNRDAQIRKSLQIQVFTES